MRAIGDKLKRYEVRHRTDYLPDQSRLLFLALPQTARASKISRVPALNPFHPVMFVGI